MVTLNPQSQPPPPPSPPSKTTVHLHLTNGAEVEVSSNEEGFRGAWYNATVIESPPRTNLRKRRKALIQYKALLAADGSTPLTEYVDPTHIRPLPPPPPTPSDHHNVFTVNDVVDANHRDGWWTGIVKKVLEPSSRYIVYFDNPPDVIEFDGTDLRPSFVWRRGAWVNRPKPLLSESNFSSGTTVEVLLDKHKLKDIWFPAILVKQWDDNTFLVKCCTKNDDEVAEAKVTVDSRHIRPAPLHFVNRRFELLETVDALYNGGWRAGVITKLLTTGRYNVFFKQGNEEKEVGQSELRPCVDWTGDNKDVQLESNTGADKQGQLQRPATETNNIEEQTRFTMKLRQTLSRQPTASKGKPTSLASSPEYKRIKSIASKGSGGVPSRLSKTASKGYKVQSSGLATGDQSLVLGQSPRDQSSGLASGESSVPSMSPPISSKRIKRENSGDHIQTMDFEKCKRRPGTSQDKIVEECNTEVPVADVQKIELNGTPVADMESSGPPEYLKQKDNLANIAKDKRRQINQQKEGSSQRRKRGRPRKFPLISEAGNKSSGTGGVFNNRKATDHSNAEVVTGSTVCGATQVRKNVGEIDDHMADFNQPLSTWIGAISSSNLEESRPLFARTVTSFSSAHDRIVTLPFMKKCSVWEATESMEAFKIIPQKPHFSPLAKLNEEIREGTAIGKMVTFSTLFEKIPKLQIEDPKSVFDSILANLLDLEKNGFHVTELKCRASDLLNMKMVKEQEDSKISQAHRTISKLNGDKEKYDVQMKDIKKKIAELHELHEAVQLKKDAEENEIVRQKAEIKNVYGRIQDAKSKFAKAASAPWKLP